MNTISNTLPRIYPPQGTANSDTFKCVHAESSRITFLGERRRDSCNGAMSEYFVESSSWYLTVWMYML